MDAQRWHDHCTGPDPVEPDHLTLRQWKKLSPAELATHIERLESWLLWIYMSTSELTDLAQWMTRVVETNAKKRPGAKDILVLTGSYAIGKSTFMKVWGQGRYITWTESASRDDRGRPVYYPAPDTEADICPVVWANLQSAANIMDLDTQILNFFGLPSSGYRKREITERMLEALERHRVRTVIIDDIHLLWTNWKGGPAVLDHIKHINTEIGEAGATLILVGADLENGDLVTDPQIAGRLKMRKIVPYAIDTEDQMRTWQSIVRDIERQVLPHLPAGKSGMLFTELVGELWNRTQGFIGDLMELVCQATLAATEDGRHVIRRQHLKAVTLSERAEVIYRRPTSKGIVA